VTPASASSPTSSSSTPLETILNDLIEESDLLPQSPTVSSSSPTPVESDLFNYLFIYRFYKNGKYVCPFGCKRVYRYKGTLYHHLLMKHKNKDGSKPSRASKTSTF
jgi:hypothetical protein